MEDYKQKYEEALGRANAKIETYSHLGNTSAVKSIYEIFPELKESEDERVRKWLIEAMKYLSEESMFFAEVSKDKVIAWLERQSEQKTVSKTEPIIEGLTTEFQKQVSHLIASVMDKEHEYDEDFVKWTANALLNYAKQELEKRVEQKPVWTKEDERYYDSALWHIKNSCGNEGNVYNWLKSLKERVQSSIKQEWNEEDKKLIDDTCHLINTLASGYGEKVTEPITLSGTQMIASIKNRLRALVDNRPQNTWKPSDEQMEALLKLEEMHVLEHEKNQENAHLYMVVKSIREQLLKLKGE